ncbi:MAG: hypothetical protein ABW189_06095 [Rickettsiales bacterium]
MPPNYSFKVVGHIRYGVETARSDSDPANVTHDWDGVVAKQGGKDDNITSSTSGTTYDACQKKNGKLACSFPIKLNSGKTVADAISEIEKIFKNRDGLPQAGFKIMECSMDFYRSEGITLYDGKPTYPWVTISDIPATPETLDALALFNNALPHTEQ